MNNEKMASTLYIENRKIKNRFELFDKLEAGVVLSGHEVKSIRDKGVNFEGSFVRIVSSELWIYNLYIEPYAMSTNIKVDPRRKRKLLVHKKEILKIHNLIKQKNLVIIPLAIYFSDSGRVKIRIGLARAKKIYEQKKKILDKIEKRELRKFKK